MLQVVTIISTKSIVASTKSNVASTLLLVETVLYAGRNHPTAWRATFVTVKRLKIEIFSCVQLNTEQTLWTFQWQLAIRASYTATIYANQVSRIAHKSIIHVQKYFPSFDTHAALHNQLFSAKHEPLCGRQLINMKDTRFW